MAKQIAFVTTDTPISGVTTNSINLRLTNFGADFVEQTNSSKKGERVITNVTAPVGVPETFRFAVSTVDDIYKGSTLEPSVRAVSKKGVRIYFQTINYLKETDTTDPTYCVYYPVRWGTTAELPLPDSFTANMAEESFRGHISGLYETGEHDSGRIAEVMRGALLPPDM